MDGDCFEVNILGLSVASLTVEAKDYETVMAQLLFSPGQDKQCVNITILEDDILEGAEDFRTTLSTSVDRVTLDPEMATVNIADDDGME